MANNDLLVDLHDVIETKVKDSDIKLVRVLSPDSDKVVEFIKREFSDEWASEAKAGLYKTNSTCFIAIKNEEILGFACYDATAKGFFGPIGVSEAARGLGLGISLVRKTLLAMKEDGYAYAIIGGASDKTHAFYEKACQNILVIPNSRKVYLRMVRSIKL